MNRSGFKTGNTVFGGGIYPWVRDDAGRIGRPNLFLKSLDQRFESHGIDKPLFDHQRFEKSDSQGQVRWNFLAVEILPLCLGQTWRGFHIDQFYFGVPVIRLPALVCPAVAACRLQ